MRFAVSLLLFTSGCAPWVWNHRYVDCAGVPNLYIAGHTLDVASGNAQQVDPCTVALTGLKETTVNADDKKIYVFDAREVLLLQNKGRPETTMVWTFSGAIDIDREDFLIELDTQRGKSTGHVTYGDVADDMTVNVRSGELDDLEIESDGDVYLHLPLEGAYRFDIHSSGVDWGEHEFDPNGVRVFVDTLGEVYLDDSLSKLPQN